MTRAEEGPAALEGRTDRLLQRLLAAEGLLLGLDFDGTLAPIHIDPDVPELSPAMERALETLANRSKVDVAIVSGRSLADLHGRVAIDGLTYAGNHGLERYRDGRRIVPGAVEDHRTALRHLAAELPALVGDVPGCRIQDKEFTLTVHVRETPPEHIPAVRQRVQRRVAAEPGLELTEGKQVFEIRPAIECDKGTVMRELVQETPATWLPLYIGDDTTDEDAFRALQPEGIGIHVGTDENTRATCQIPSQDRVESFLTWLATATSG